jgi:hypothetical protein
VAPLIDCHHAATACQTRCTVQARRVVSVPASAAACVTVAADHSRASVSRLSVGWIAVAASPAAASQLAWLAVVGRL